MYERLYFFSWRENFCRTVLLVFLLSLGGSGIVVLAEDIFPERPAIPLRLDVPLADVVRDLKIFIPDRLQEANIPGISVVLIRDNRIVWSEGFGKQNYYLQQPVSRKTVFEVASISKAVAAFGALKLVDRGLLDLDMPLDSYLSEPWLQDAEGREKITLRHILTHTSGLSNDVRSGDRKLKFSPGEIYSYSGMGFVYLQHVMETKFGMSLDSIMADEIYTPYAMSNASYAPEFITDDFAEGHMPLPGIISMLLPITLAAGILLLVICLVVNKLRLGKLAISKRSLIGVFILSVLLSGTLLIAPAGMALTVAWMIAYILYIAVGIIVFFGGKWVLHKGFSDFPHVSGWLNNSLNIVILLAIFLGLYVATSRILVPVPGAPVRNGSIAWSLHITAEDMARFAIAILELESSGSDVTRQIIEPQVQLDDGSFWGMGLGLRQGDAGRSFYHTGTNPGFEAILIGYPQQGTAMVVLTNGQGGKQLAQDIIIGVLGKEADLGNNLNPFVK